MKRWTIYCHTHVESGRRYIGLTQYTMLHRWNQHCVQAKNVKSNRSHFANAIMKYGKDAFSHEVLAMSWDLESANETEQIIIEQEGTRDPKLGFNLTKGGGFKQSPHPKSNPWERPEFRDAVTAGVKASWQDPAFQIKMSKISREVNSRPEVKQKISAAHTGRPISQERKDRLADLKRGTKRSPELNAKLAAIQASDEYINKQRAAHLGKKPSDLTRQKISAASKSSDPEMRSRIAESVRAYHVRRRAGLLGISPVND